MNKVEVTCGSHVQEPRISSGFDLKPIEFTSPSCVKKGVGVINVGGDEAEGSTGMMLHG